MTDDESNKLVRKSTGAAYVSFLIYLLFFARFRDITQTEINLIPFGSIGPLTHYTFTSNQDWFHWFINVPGNILAFVPVPFFFKVFYKKPIKFWNSFLVSFSIPIIIESAQFIFQRGSCDIDDWMLNFLGMMIGYYFIIKKQKQPTS